MSEDPSRIGKYDIEGVIGEGGMGVVYKGRDPLIDRVVAIKTIRTDDKSDQEELLKRLQMEARSAGKLAHPNIVVIHDFGEQEGLTYLVMEYVEGRNLARIIKSGRQIPFATKIDIIIQLCQGLDYAHGLGVTHRDIKPGNIAITARGTAKILDFGLARVDSTRLTKTGFTSGTIAYMSPERMRGDAGASDDVFALGAVAYELLAYQRAFPGTTYSDVVTKVLSDQYPKPLSSVTDLPAELDPILQKSMARDVKDRYQTPGELGKALESFRNTLAYQNYAETSGMGDAEVLADDAPLSSTANPYSAGAMTPSPAEHEKYDTQQVPAGENEPSANDMTVQTKVSDLAIPDPVERTKVRPANAPADSESAVPTEAMSPLDRRGRAGPVQEGMTAVRPAEPAGGLEPDRDGATVARPKPDLEGPTEAMKAPDLEGPTEAMKAPDLDGPTEAMEKPKLGKEGADEQVDSGFGTAIMSSFKRLVKRDIDPQAHEPTVVDERPAMKPGKQAEAQEHEPTVANRPVPKRPGSRQPGNASGAPATGRTVAYAPGSRPSAGGPAGAAPTAAAPAAPGARPGAAPAPVRARRGGLVGMWLPSGAILLSILAAAALAHVSVLPVYIAVYGAAILAWIWLLRSARVFTLKQAMTIGLLLRIGLVFIPPAFAAESLRGLWDGRMVANGLNPYAVAPLSDEVTFDRPSWFTQLSSPDQPTTTPPWALFIFMIVAWVGGGMFLWKLILLIVEIVTIRLLAREKTGHAMMLYATCPLLILEGIWHGRIEVIVIAFLVAASWATRQRGEIQGGVLAGIGLGTSFLAIPSLPALWGTAERMLKMIIPTVLAAALPLLIFSTRGQTGARLRDLLFGPELSGIGLVWLTERIEQARLGESIAENARQIAWAPLANAFSGITAADIAAVTVGALFLVVLIVITKRSLGPDAAIANCLGVFFLLTALFSPAGWILLVPFAIAARQPLWILWGLVTPLWYLFPEEGTSWMLLITLYALPPILYFIFRGDDGRVHLFDSGASEPAHEPFKETWDPPKRKPLY